MSVVKGMGGPLVAAVATILVALSPTGGQLEAQSGTPGAPAIDSVSAGDGALRVAWSAPSDTGTTTITAYDVRRIETSASDKADGNWTVVSDVWAVAGPLSGTLVNVDNGTEYDVQVRAVNSRGDGAWSATVTGTPADHGDSRGSATVIALQTPTPGLIASSSDDDYFQFTLSEATGVFIYTTSYLSGFLSTTGELQDSGGSTIKSDDGDAGIREHGDQLFLWDSLAAGTYYVRVEASEAGAYTLHTQLVPDGSALDDAVDINLGESVGGILDTSSDEEDYYRIELAQRTDVFIRIARANAGLDPLGTLLDEDGNALVVHDDSFFEGDRKRHFLFRRELDAGVYFLKVDPAPEATYDVCRGFVPLYNSRSFVNCGDTESKSAASTGGPYVVTVEEARRPGSSISSARAIPVDENVLTAGRIDSGGDSDYFSITVSQPTHVAVQVVSDEVETSGTLYNSSRRETAAYSSETDYVPGGYGFILYAQLATGTSYVRVSGDGSSETGGYTIRAVEDAAYVDFLNTCTAISTSYSDPLYGCQWYLKNTGQNTGIASGTSGEDINVEQVWAGGNLGEGIYVAMVDDGLETTHEDLRDNVDTSKNYDYVYRGGTYEQHFNRGTQLAGLIAGRDNSTGMRGVAPRATLFNLNAVRYPTTYRLSNAMTRHADITAVSNNGWAHISGPGFNHSSSTWELAMEEGLAEGFNDKGTFYTVPAGSGATEGDYSNLSGYANYRGVTAVCAVNDLGERVTLSEKGSNLWVCAPSADADRQAVTTTLPYGRYSMIAGGTGTATALVSGVAALVRKANAELTWRDVKLVLAGSARKNHTGDSDWTSGALKYGSTTDRYNFNHSYGFGVVDAKAAVDLAATWTNLPRLKSLRAESARELDVTIADSATVSRQVTVGPGIDFIEYIDVTIDLLHPSFRDLKVELVSPSSAVSVLSASYSGDDKYEMDGQFRLGTAKHLGENAAGTWTLRLVDEVTGNSGTLNFWSLRIYGHGTSVQSTGITNVVSKSEAVEVAWSGIDDPDITGYDVRHIRTDATDKADANWTVVEDVRTGAGPFSYEITGLTNAVSYDVQVRGAAAVDGSWSDTVTGTPTADAAAVPRLTDVLSEEDALGLAWSAPTTPVATVTAYDVRHIRSDATDKADANWTVVDDAWTAGALVYVITGLSNGVLYDVQVRAVTSNGDGTWSSTAKGQPREIGDARRAAAPLAFDVPVHAAMDYSTDIDVYRIDVSAETEVFLSTTGSTDTIGELFDADGDSVRFNDDAGPSLNFAMQLTLAAGSYFLEVTGWSGDTGPYVLVMETPEEDQDSSEALTITLGGSIEALITLNDADYYELVLAAETEVLLYSSGDTDTVGELQDDSGTALVTNDDAYLPSGIRNFLIRRTLAAGTYKLKVTGYFTTVGEYTVHAKAATAPGSASTSALSLAFDAPKGGNIDPAGDTDYYTFTLAEATSVNIVGLRDPGASSTPDLEAELLDSDLATVDAYFAATSSYRGESFEINDHLAAGTYYLKVTAESATDTASYIVMATESGANRELDELCVGLNTDISDPYYGCQWYLESDGQLPDLSDSDINIGDVWDDYKGDGITVAIVDDGLDYRHADLRGDRTDTDKNYSYVEDRGVDAYSPTHGTSVAGIIAARENNLGIRGIAPEATIYAYNLLVRSTDENEADALTREAATTAVYNNSWGVPDLFAGPAPAPATFRLAIESGITDGYGGKGSFYAWAAGNGHGYGDYSTLEEYSNHYGVTAVCAVNSHGKRATYSELGANLWVCGSSNGGGRGVLTTTYPNTFTPNFGGTSAASPMVAGVVALLREANANLTWRDLKLILAASAQKVDADNTGWEEGALKYGSTTDRYDFNHEYGFGLVDAEAAVTLAESWTLLPKFRRLTSSSGSIELAIPDMPSVGSPTVVTSTLTVEPYVDFVEYVEIEVHVAHESFRDMQIELVSPSGAVSVLSPHYSSEESGFFSFLFFLFLLLFGLPDADWDEPIDFGSAKHLGENGAGEWTLRISDHYSQDTGTLRSWSITVYGHGDSPEIPEIDTVTAGVRSATVAWTAPDDPNSAITSYDLRHADASNTDLTPDDWTVVTSIWTSGDLSYTLTGLDASHNHAVQIRAVSSEGAGPWSAEEEVQPTLAVPTAATIDEVRSGDRSLGLFWQAPSEALGDEITSYDVRYILTSADETVDANWTVRRGVWRSGPLRYSIGSLTNDSEYDVQVRAVNAEGAGAWSGTSMGTPADRVNVTLSWDRPAVSVGEDVGTVTLKATLTTTEAGAVPSAFSVDVGIEATGTAAMPTDFTLDATTLTFAGSDFAAVTIGGDERHRAQKDVVVAIRNDGRIENTESFTLKLVYQGLVMSHLGGNDASAVVTISDNDHVPVSLTWDKSSVAIDEDSGRVVLNAIAETTMNRAPGDNFALQALVSAVPGTATVGQDYMPVLQRVVFPKTAFRRSSTDGLSRYRASVRVEFPITDDGMDEPDETITLVLAHANPSLRHAVGEVARASVLIRDDDYGPVRLALEQSSSTVAEDGASVTFTAHVTTETDLAPESGFAIDVTVSATGVSAVAGSDFRGLSTTTRFRQSDFTSQMVNGEPRYRASKEYTVTILEDTVDEPDEQFRFTLSYTVPSLSHQLGGSQEAFVTITDNDHVPVTLGWEQVEFTAEEPTSPGGTTSVSLTAVASTSVDKRPESGFTFDYTVNSRNGTARQPADYQQLSTTGTFDRNDFSRTLVDGHYRYVASSTFTVEVEHDITNEPNETLTVRLAYDGASQPHLLLGDTTATITITDDIASLTDLRTTVSASLGTVSRGNQITYDWSIDNSGPSASTSTRLVATLDAGTSFVSATPTGQCSGSGSRVTCNLGTLEVGESISGTIVVEIKDTASADLDFSARAYSDQLDRTPGDNTGSEHTELLAPPKVVTGLKTSPTTTYIDLTWTKPGDNGSELTGYRLDRKVDDGDYETVFPGPEPAVTSYRDDDVEIGKEYTYRILAINIDGDAEWSVEITTTPQVPPPPPIISTGGGGGGGFGPAPVAPKFADGFRTTRNVAVNAKAGDVVGAPVLATHQDDLEITYSLSGADAARFTVDEQTGQIRVREGATLDRAIGERYAVNLTATDSAGIGAIIAVVIEVAEASHHRYDANGNGTIERDEVIAAVKDYFDGEISRDEVIELVKLYFDQSS